MVYRNISNFYDDNVESSPILINDVCMSQEIFDSNNMTERNNLFKKYLPNELEFEIVNITNSQKCMACKGTMTPFSSNDNSNKCDPSKGYNEYYKRMRYLGNQNICCFKNDIQNDKVHYDLNGDQKDNLTCHPNFLKHGSLDCRSVKNKFCSLNSNIFTDERCKEHCTMSKLDCYDIKKEICNNPNKYKNNKKYCDTFCLENEGHCDNSIINFCKIKKNFKEPICSCVNSIFKNPEFQGINPKCIDKECMIHGYSTMALKNTTNKTTCPQVNCQLIVQNSGLEFNLKNNILKNNCGLSDTELLKHGDTTIHKEDNFNYLKYYLLFMFLIIIICILIK